MLETVVLVQMRLCVKFKQEEVANNYVHIISVNICNLVVLRATACEVCEIAFMTMRVLL